jgi:putative transposase
MKVSIYYRYRFHYGIIRRDIWLYFWFNLSFRDIEELMVERGFEVPSNTWTA